MPQIQPTDRALAVAPLDQLAALAREEIARHFGPDFQFHTAPPPTTEIRLHAYCRGNWLVLVPLGPALWCLDTVDMRRITVVEPVRFSDRAVALINGLALDLGEIEQAARDAMAQVDESDHTAFFSIAIEHLYFAAWRDGNSTAEVDLVDAPVPAKGVRS